MNRNPFRPALRRLYALVAPPAAVEAADGELLARFAERRDEAAFAALVGRHGRMVLGLCRRLLRHEQDAEDAFQAAFLILARKAASVGKGDSVGSWLYKVAFRVALRARAQSARRSAREPQGLEFPPAADDDAAAWRDLRPVLDEEVRRLPEKYRRPVLLCYLGGRTTEEAARQLGCPRGTVLSRLAAARQRLRAGLTRRGVAVSVAALAALLGRQAARAAPAARLMDDTVRAAGWFAAGNAAAAGALSARAAALSQGVLKDMFRSKLRTTTALALLAVIGAGVALWNSSRPAATAAGPVASKKDDAPPAADAGKSVDARKPDPLPAPKGDDAAARWAPPRPVGQWERRFGPCDITLRIDEDRLHGVIVVAADKGAVETVAIDADYSVNKEGTMYGVVTGVDYPDMRFEGNEVQKAAEAMTLAVDQPFAVRYRVDDNVLTIRDVKFMTGAKDADGLKELAVLLGRYKRKQGGDKEAP
jgi:RNA polymerase sigma factor (sigma-70 family)